MAGYTISILTLGLVLGPVVAGAPVLAGALRVAVGIYLLLLALRLWRRRPVGHALATRRPVRCRRAKDHLKLRRPVRRERSEGRPCRRSCIGTRGR